MESRQRILIVDDEPSVMKFVSMGLADAGFDVDEAPDGRTALQRFHEFGPHLVVLDRMLPDMDGIEVCTRIRSVGRVPVLMLTAVNDVEDRVQGLEGGADDYVGKPIRLNELVARIRALLRRVPSNRVTIGSLVLDTAERHVTCHGLEATLTPRECDLLLALMRRPDQVVSRPQLLQSLWGFEFEGETNVLEVHIRALRTKLGDTERTIIRSIRGVGYALRSDAVDVASHAR